MSSINDNLKNAFDTHRVVFWYDPQGESKEQFEEIDIPEVKKVEADHNAFELKYRILKQEKEQCFLLYFPYERPENSENWLLDIELSNFVFDTEQAALYLQEMGLDYTYKKLIQTHDAFFGAKNRRQKFVGLFNKTDSKTILKYKMLKIVLATDNYDLQNLVQAYANSYFTNLERINKDLERFNLKDFIWNEIEKRYRYKDDQQNIYEFIIAIFENSFTLTRKTNLAPDARLILSSWRDSYTMRDSYRKMALEISDILKIEQLLQEAPLEEIVQDELFELTDQKIIFELVGHLLDDSISTDRFQKVIKTRESKFWFSTYRHLYRALENAFALFGQITKVKTGHETAEKAIQEYLEEDYKIDFYYRKFYEHFHQAKKQNILKQLIGRLEKIYVNDWLFTQGNAYQKLLSQKPKWKFDEHLMQRDFYEKKVDPILEKQKLVVIISDALRYECGVELASEINKISRFKAKQEMMISSLPSYTQLGMASLLPHKELSFDDESLFIKADGVSSKGTKNREKILVENSGRTAKALRIKDYLKDKNTAKRKKLNRDYEILYVYSNKIDQVGDEKMSENEVFEAAREEIKRLTTLVQAAFSANASRVLVTSDHGFLYQDSPVNDGDFIETKFKGDTFGIDRRFVVGKKLVNEESAVHFQAEDLYINPPAEVLITKGISRFKVKGSGSRFVHGAASIQETLIPLLDITKGREDTVKQVEIDIIQSHNKITTNSLPIEFIQKEAISEKVLPVEIKAFVRARDGEVLSNTFNFIFDFGGNEHRQRAKRFTFQMNSEASNKYRNQMVDLVLQVPIEGTSRWKDYKSFGYTINISFASDFD